MYEFCVKDGDDELILETTIHPRTLAPTPRLLALFHRPAMSFLQLLQLHLDPHLSDSLFPEVDLGVRCCSWVDGRFSWGGVQDGFRKLTRKELYALVRRLKKSPSVTLLNLYGHAIEKEMILEFVNPIAALSDLQVLAVPGTSTYPPYPPTLLLHIVPPISY